MLQFVLALWILFSPSLALYQQENAACEADERLMEHLYGEICIPATPERVIALDSAIIELMLVLGVEQIAASDLFIQGYSRMHPELIEDYTAAIEGLPDVGFPPNLEVILEADPDVIIAPDVFISRALYDELSPTLPIIVYAVEPGEWRERLILAGEVLNASEAVADLLAAYDARVEDLQTALGDEASEIEVSLVRTFPGQIGLVVSGTMAQSVLDEVGLARPSGQDVSLNFVAEENGGRPELLIQQEEIGLADGDVIFLFGDTSEISDDPLWNALPGVRDGRAYEVGYYWWGDSLLSAHDMLDDLFAYVAETEPEIANPFEDGLPETEE